MSLMTATTTTSWLVSVGIRGPKDTKVEKLHLPHRLSPTDTSACGAVMHPVREATIADLAYLWRCEQCRRTVKP